MQTPILPVQSSSNIAAQQAKAGPSAGAADGVDFQSALTRQIEQRQAQNRGGQAPAPMPARNTAPAPHRPAAAAAQLPPKPAPQQQAGAATPAPAQPQAKAAPEKGQAHKQKPTHKDQKHPDQNISPQAKTTPN
ncbi:hypothetical protein ACFDR9_005365, partial [Janthinobacterium sp. CG_23.3]